MEDEPGNPGIDTPGSEMVVAGDAPVPAAATLFHTDDPAEVVKRATDVANVLSRVLREKELTKKIGNREHVLVEGWTLCGSMLGVFAVPVWTRKLTDPEGWEARVEARTIAGATIGAAEAQCTRDENMWSHEPHGRNGNKLEARDDYALRSMAQTRASSKALRLPLGFIVTLAGFDATPAEEMPASESAEPQRRREGPPSYPVPKSWPKIQEAVRKLDNPDEAWALFEAFLRAASYHLYGEADSAALSTEERRVVAQKAAGAAVWLMDHPEATFVQPEFNFATEENMRMAWGSVMEGADLPIPDYVAPEPPAPEPPETDMGSEYP